MSDISSMQVTLLDALDDITSTRSSASIRSEGLTCLEKLIAIACLSSPSSQTLDHFLALQDTFECNVPSRLISWIGLATHTLECSAARTLSPHPTDVETLAAQVSQALTLIQGVALNHKPSKRYLGRQHSLEILLDLLITSRHVPPPSLQPALSLSSTSSAPFASPALSSVVLDTLLCILVDSSSALRAFEDAAGVKCVVKILKRAGTPKEVRMKCLEFLYFYLLDENPSSASAIDEYESPLLSPVSPSPAPADSYRAMSPPPLVMPTAASYQTKTTPNTPQRKLGLGAPGRRGLRKSNTEGQIPPVPTPLAISEDVGLASSTSSSRAPSRAESTSSRASSDSRSNPTQSQTRPAPTQTSRLHTRTRSEASQSHRTLSFASSTSSASSSSKPSSFSSHRPTSSISSVASTSSTSSKAPSERRPSVSSHHSPPPLPVHRPPSLSPSSSQATPTGPRATRSSRSNSQSTSTSTSIFASQPNRLVMLRKDVDYVPQSPVKTSHGSQTSHLDALLLSRRNSDASTTSSTTSSFDGAHHEQHLFSPRKASVNDSTSSRSILSTSIVSSAYSRSGDHGSSGRGRDERKTTEEKKALLGSFLGNVDALVEGVRKAGVWGLS